MRCVHDVRLRLLRAGRPPLSPRGRSTLRPVYVVEAPLSEAPPAAHQTSGDAIRRRFLNFFEARGHTVLPSSSLVPEDPTVLLTIAGMLQFKPVFLGQVPRAVARATTTQKCVRTNDIENVGVTKRHHTFFEMLGNFSFGDYFKKDAIRWAWQLATSEFGLPADRVWVSVFEKDEEALALWRDDVGVPTARIQRLGAKDNFWAAGPTGPCGPCSELYYDFHPERGLEGASLEDDTRFIEFYNLVFMESNRDAAGVLTPLAAPCIDTGMGLERMAQILQRVPNNYETDLLFPIVSEAAAMAGIEYDAASEAQRTRLKVLADHVRAVTYLLSDGVLPSNVGRGYVVRRLVRRAVRAGRLLGCVARAGNASSPCFTPALARVAISLSPGCDPGVARNSARICAELEREEARFGATLARGEALLSSQIDAALASPLPDGRCVLPGAAAFLLYDTFGFPLEITIEAAAERCVSVDTAGFEAAMASARALSQAAVVGIDVTTGDDVAALAATHGDTRFVGYTSLESPARLLALRVGGVEVPSAEAGEAVEVLLDATPFYASGGGQAGDSGVISQHGVSVRVTDTVRAAGGRLIFHRGVVEGDGRMEAGGAPATASIDASSRRRAAAHHTATHLLHAALRETLGSGVGQAGSAVDAARLRFDFTSDSPPSPEQLRAIEARVNGWVSDAAGVATREVPLAEARASGAVAMFGEKYGNVVRVVDVPGVSMELCGGTHVGNTSQVGAFKIVSEGGIAAGVRRIEAVAGSAAVELLQQRDGAVRSLAAALKVQPDKVEARVGAMADEARRLAAAVEGLKAELAIAKCEGALAVAATTPCGARLLVHRLDGFDPPQLAAAAAHLLESLGGTAAVVLGGEVGGRVALVASFSPAVVKRGASAGALLAQLAKACGGGGGGKPGFAQAGGKDASKLAGALETATQVLTSQLQ